MIHRIIEAILEETKRRAPKAKIDCIIMNEVLQDMHTKLEKELTIKIQHETARLYAYKKVLITGRTLEFVEEEPGTSSLPKKVAICLSEE